MKRKSILAKLRKYPDKVFTVKDAAELAGVSDAALYAAIDSGRLPKERFLGRTYFIRASSLHNYMVNVTPQRNSKRKKKVLMAV